MRIEGCGPDALIPVSAHIEVDIIALIDKSSMLPDVVSQLIPAAGTFFPITPGPVIGILAVFLKDQDTFVMKCRIFDERHCQVQTCCTCTDDDIVVYF